MTVSVIRKWGSLHNVDLRSYYLIRLSRIMPLLIVLVAILSILHGARIRGYVVNPSATSLGRAVLAALTFNINIWK